LKSETKLALQFVFKNELNGLPRNLLSREACPAVKEILSVFSISSVITFPNFPEIPEIKREIVIKNPLRIL
jgi:hypothetical protein